MTLAARGAEPEPRGYCGKVPHLSRRDAEIDAHRQESFGHPPAVAYACPTAACRRAGLWHLSSTRGSPRSLLDWAGRKPESNATTSTTTKE